VLEQIDGVNLRAGAGRGNGWILADGAYETRRATEAGRRVLREYESLEAIVCCRRERAVASEPRARSAPAKRRARERVGESEGRSPSDRNDLSAGNRPAPPAAAPPRAA
jgi:hypothetical protein